MNKRPSWKEFFAFGIVMFAFGGGVVGLWKKSQYEIRTPEIYWRGDTLIVRSMTGWKEINYLVTNEGAARLPEPIFLLDSASHEIPPEIWKKLVWRMDNGMSNGPPPIGSPVTGMFIGFKPTRSRNAEP